MGERWLVDCTSESLLLTSFSRVPALPTKSKCILYKGKKANTDAASEDLDDDNLAESALIEVYCESGLW